MELADRSPRKHNPQYKNGYKEHDHQKNDRHSLNQCPPSWRKSALSLLRTGEIDFLSKLKIPHGIPPLELMSDKGEYITKIETMTIFGGGGNLVRFPTSPKPPLPS